MVHDAVGTALREAGLALERLRSDSSAVRAAGAAGAALAACLKAGGKILACGNGGSACDAAHFAEELTGRFRADRPALAALACNDAGHLTCTANDFGFEQVFSRWIEALARPGDAVVLLSTSGNSGNVVASAKAAGKKGVTRIALLGKGGGAMRGLCEHEVIVPGETSERVQELHMVLLHAWVEQIERELFGV